jgi:hypothetical protein
MLGILSEINMIAIILNVIILSGALASAIMLIVIMQGGIMTNVNEQKTLI